MGTPVLPMLPGVHCTTNNERRAKLPSEFEVLLVTELWRPVLDTMDLEGANGQLAPLPATLFTALIALIQQAHIPATILGPGVALHLPLVTGALRRLHVDWVEWDDAAPMKALELIEHVASVHTNRHGPGTATEVHALAASL